MITPEQWYKLSDICIEPELHVLLNRVAYEMPLILKGEGCSIFLLPDFFPESIPIDEEVRKAIADKEGKIVLLAATYGLDSSLIGKAYYEFNEGITGWIARHGLPINLGDVSNSQEREAVARKVAQEAGIEYTPISWSMKYNESNLPGTVSRPFLGVPIKSPRTSKVIGVLRLCALQSTERWTDTYEMILRGFANLLGGQIERDYITGTLLRFLQEGDKDALLTQIANRAHRLVNGAGCSIFLQDEKDSDRIVIKASTLPRDEWEGRQYRRNGKGCTSWIFTNGAPLKVKNIQDIEELGGIDRNLFWSGVIQDGRSCESKKPGPFLGAPIKVEGECIGVIRIPRDADAKPFTDKDLEIIGILAGQASLVLELQRRLIKRHQLKEQERNRLINIYELGSKMQEELHNLERLYHLFLTGLTHGDVIGINRALLFKYEPDLRQLKGKSALGPVDREEAIEFEDLLNNANLDLGACISEFEHRGGLIESKLRTKVCAHPFYLDEECQCLSLIENGDEDVVELDSSPLSNSLRGLLDSIGAAKVCCFTLTVTPDHLYLIMCDNVYDSDGIDNLTRDFLKLYLDQSLRAFQRTYQEEEIREAKAKVWRQLSTIAAHRLGQLLPIVQNRLDEIIMRNNDTKDRNSLEEIHGLVVRASDAIFDFKRISTEIDVKLDNRLTVRDLLKQFQSHLGKTYKNTDVNLEFGNHDEDLFVAVDLNGLNGVVETLVDNSREAKSEGLVLALKSCEATTAEINKYKLPVERPYCMISISDNGPGVRDDLKERIFEPFFTTKSRGSGVGLTIVKQVIEEHGGKVVEDGKSGNGALFKIFLPIFQGDA